MESLWNCCCTEFFVNFIWSGLYWQMDDGGGGGGALCGSEWILMVCYFNDSFDILSTSWLVGWIVFGSCCCCCYDHHYVVIVWPEEEEEDEKKPLFFGFSLPKLSNFFLVIFPCVFYIHSFIDKCVGWCFWSSLSKSTRKTHHQQQQSSHSQFIMWKKISVCMLCVCMT